MRLWGGPMPSVSRIISARAANPAQSQMAGPNPAFVQTEGGITWLSQGGVTGMPMVTDDTALTISAVYRATVLVASTIASFPRRVIDETTGESVREPREQFLWRRPNPEVSAMEFWETVIGHEFLNGNAFVYVEKDGLGLPVALWPIVPGRVRIHRDKLSGRKLYTLDGDTSLPFADMTNGGEICHIASFGRDGLRGLSLVRLMASALSLAVAAEDFASRTFANGTHLAGVLETDQDLNPDVAEALMARWERYNTGLRNAHKTAVMSNGLKWKQLSIDPGDAQMIETRKFQVLDVSRFTGIPAYMLDPEKTSSWGTGVAEQNQGFVTYTLTPHKVRFDQTVTDELVFTSDRRFEFDVSGLLRGKMKDQVDAAGALVRAGFDPAESLRAVGLPPIRHTGRLPVTVQGDDDPAREPAEE